jgi:hypothetical protein
MVRVLVGCSVVNLLLSAALSAALLARIETNHNSRNVDFTSLMTTINGNMDDRFRGRDAQREFDKVNRSLSDMFAKLDTLERRLDAQARSDSSVATQPSTQPVN